MEAFGLHCVDETDIPLSPNVTYHIKKVYQYLANGVTDADILRDEIDMALQAAALGVPTQYYQDIAICSLFAE